MTTLIKNAIDSILLLVLGLAGLVFVVLIEPILTHVNKEDKTDD